MDRDATTSRKLANFVNQVLLLRGRSFLQRFRLKCYRVYDNSLPKACLINILQCDVQELDISIDLTSCVLPSDIFLCRTLVILKLDAKGSHVTMPTSACLPNLTALHLTKVQLSNDALINSLLSGCPVLEELSLCECIGKDVHVINISAVVLKSLIIEYLPYGMNEVDYQIVIDTPALENLDFTDCISKVYVVKKMDSLINAKIEDSGSGVFTDEFRELCSGAVKNLLNAVSQVKSLFLTSEAMAVISPCDLALPTFSNLTCLNLSTAYDTRLIATLKLIENSPCLKKLCFYQGVEYNIDEDLDTFPFHDVPSSFHSHLKEIEIDNFRYSENEMKIVDYFLKNAKVLEKLTLRYNFFDVEDDAEVRELFLTDLLLFPRASAICKVVVRCE